MTDELDMIPTIVFASKATEGDYTQREEPHLLNIEYTDEDVMSINIFGPKWDYQLQVKISSLFKLVREAGIMNDDE